MATSILSCSSCSAAHRAFALSRSHPRPHINGQAGCTVLKKKKKKSLLCNLCCFACCSVGLSARPLSKSFSLTCLTSELALGHRLFFVKRGQLMTGQYNTRGSAVVHNINVRCVAAIGIRPSVMLLLYQQYYKLYPGCSVDLMVYFASANANSSATGPD